MNLSISLFKLFKVIFVIVYSVLAVEGLMRVMEPVPMMPRYVNALPCGVRGNTPNQNYCHSTAEYNIFIRTNSKGIRSDQEIRYEKPSTIKRVLLLGDSFGMGYGVNADEMFTAKMVHYLKLKYGIAAEVVNLSTSGHGNAEELIVLLNEGLKYEPDLVLLCWHYTDLKDNVRSNLFGLVDGQLIRKANTYLPGVKERQFLNNFMIYRFVAENSQIYNFIRNWAGKKVKKLLAAARFKKDHFVKNKVKKKNKTHQSYEKKLTVTLLERIQSECRKKGSGFLIFDIPFRVSRTKFISKFPCDKKTGAKPFMVVSPIEKFNERVGEQLYWERGDGHFTPLGCDLAGECIADYVKIHHLLEN